jgi:hypothetical protein
MQDISIRNAWNQGVALLFGDWKTAATYLAMAIVIPFLLFSIHDGSNFRTFMALTVDQGVFAASAETPWTILSLFLFSTIALGSVAFAWWNAVLPASRDGVVGEVMYGLAAGLICTFVSVMIYLLINLPIAIATVFVVQIMSAAAGTATATPATAITGSVGLMLLNFAQLLLLLWVSARLSMTGPAMAATGSINPFAALARSWRLTGQAQWRIFFYLLLFQAIGFVALVVFVSAAAGLVSGTYDFGWQDRAITIGWMLLECALMALFLIVSGGLYRELANDTDISAFE